MIVHWTDRHVKLVHLLMTKEEAVDFIDLILVADDKTIPDSMVDACYAVAAAYSALTGGENPAPDVDWGWEDEDA